jgi:diaminohydroxyphosphoribosylaminopyrimidine deaminase / 5-amino-6-(5-phosphoribosylamino)uracil reductase
LAESFINEHAWDEARVIESSKLIIGNGLQAPLLSNHKLVSSETIATDIVSYYKNNKIKSSEPKGVNGQVNYE